MDNHNNNMTLTKIQISGPTLASLLDRVSSSSGDIDGLLFGHVTTTTPITLSDDPSPSSTTTISDQPTLTATVTSFFSSTTTATFYTPSGDINTQTLTTLTSNQPPLIGWFSSRRKTHLRPSMRETLVTSSLISTLGQNPCFVFMLLTTAFHGRLIHTHEYKAFQYVSIADIFVPKSLDVVNLGLAFRGHDDMLGHGYDVTYWGKEEDAKLVDALMELHVSGKYVYAAIEPEYAHAVQRLMDPSLLYTMKTVKSRMSNLEMNFYILHNMLSSRYRFSWDPEKACVIADKQVWDEYLNKCPDADQFRKRPFPHYAKLCIIYGQEYATGPQTDGLGGKVVVGENQVSPIVEAKDLRVVEDVPSSYGVLVSGSSKRKRDDDDKGLRETCAESLEKRKNAIEDFGPTFIKNSNRVANQGINNAASDMMDKLVTQMEDLPSLTLDERLIAMSVIGRSAALSKMFDRLDEDGKVRMAQMVANGSIT